jgi:perosamine synthetase
MLIPHNQPTLGHAEQEAAMRVLSSGWVAQGREVQAFEDEVCRYLGLGSAHAVAVSSGTAALFMALWVLHAKGKRVAVPAYSCAAVRNAVIMAGGEPIPIDVEQDSPNIDLEQAVDARADLIIAAHMFGIAARWDSRKIDVPIIEDCAQAFGARIDGRAVGVNGAVGIFSFYATKMLTSGGQGGMLVSANKSLVDAVRDYREFDCRRDRTPRFNFQMTDLQAAVGRAQLSQIDWFLARRKHTYGRYLSVGLPLWPEPPHSGIESCHYRAVIRVTNPHSVIARCEQAGIRAIVPIEDWELLDDTDKLLRARSLARNTVSIPIYPSLADSVIPDVARAVKDAVRSSHAAPI